ncbi:N-acetyltransferase family protein [Peribacillus saganii]|uniref:N-acetyltransferase family protein n=1 Tax=Peribacillus saganii TaxID=2303992 RepID=A0A372LQV0_9BACI|nr:GNAT family N-acetyltransferase [Peribacillus saganii]RFU70053.1 N-acetyltransferase family protein [Peribacillus saganii]
MENVIFRDAKYNDLPKIIEIYNSTVASRMVTADTEPVSVKDRLGWFNEHSAETRPLWVITKDEKIAGWLSFQSFYGRPAYQATAEISIYLDEAFRGQGLGRSALSKAIESAPELGIKTILGFIFHHNRPSLKLFEAFGFETWAHLPRIAELDGVERDLDILGKRIS